MWSGVQPVHLRNQGPAIELVPSGTFRKVPDARLQRWDAGFRRLRPSQLEYMPVGTMSTPRRSSAPHGRLTPDASAVT